MDGCPACNSGALQEQLIETCMRRGERTVILRNVPALVCDVCGERVFSQDVAERLARFVDPNSREVPTSFEWTPAYDLARADAARARGERPVVTGGAEQSSSELREFRPDPPVITITGNKTSLIRVA